MQNRTPPSKISNLLSSFKQPDDYDLLLMKSYLLENEPHRELNPFLETEGKKMVIFAPDKGGFYSSSIHFGGEGLCLGYFPLIKCESTMKLKVFVVRKSM